MCYQYVLVEKIQTNVCRMVVSAVIANLRHSNKQPYTPRYFKIQEDRSAPRRTN
jgi:hypothetical protein